MFSKFDKRSQGVQQNLSVKYMFVISWLAFIGFGYCLCSLAESSCRVRRTLHGYYSLYSTSQVACKQALCGTRAGYVGAQSHSVSARRLHHKAILTLSQCVRALFVTPVEVSRDLITFNSGTYLHPSSLSFFGARPFVVSTKVVGCHATPPLLRNIPNRLCHGTL